jgi:hypothetical protein
VRSLAGAFSPDVAAAEVLAEESLAPEFRGLDEELLLPALERLFDPD